MDLFVSIHSKMNKPIHFLNISVWSESKHVLDFVCEVLYYGSSLSEWHGTHKRKSRWTVGEDAGTASHRQISNYTCAIKAGAQPSPIPRKSQPPHMLALIFALPSVFFGLMCDPFGLFLLIMSFISFKSWFIFSLSSGVHTRWRGFWEGIIFNLFVVTATVVILL